jgi:hypothetical protein
MLKFFFYSPVPANPCHDSVIHLMPEAGGLEGNRGLNAFHFPFTGCAKSLFSVPHCYDRWRKSSVVAGCMRNGQVYSNA